MAITVVTPPVVEPVTLDEAKLHLRVDTDADDNLIMGLISVARQYCETFTGRCFVERDIVYTLDRWPYRRAIVLPRPPVTAVTAVSYLDADNVTQTLTAGTDYITDLVNNRVILPRGKSWPTETLYEASPIRITYTAGYPFDISRVVVDENIGTGDDTETVFTVSNVPVQSVQEVRLAGTPTTAYTINLQTGAITFTAAPGAGEAITVDYTPEIAYTAAIPEFYKAAIKLCLGAWYENREAVLPAGNAGKELPMGVTALLWMDRYHWTEEYNQ